MKRKKARKTKKARQGRLGDFKLDLSGTESAILNRESGDSNRAGEASPCESSGAGPGLTERKPREAPPEFRALWDRP